MLAPPALAPADRAILERRIRPLIRAELVEEHRASPLGPHSPELTEVLHFLRRHTASNRPRYVLLRDGDPPRWRVGVRAQRIGEPFVVADQAEHTSREAAEHAVFLLRLSDLGLLP